MRCKKIRHAQARPLVQNQMQTCTAPIPTPPVTREKKNEDKLYAYLNVLVEIIGGDFWSLHSYPKHTRRSEKEEREVTGRSNKDSCLCKVK